MLLSAAALLGACSDPEPEPKKPDPEKPEAPASDPKGGKEEKADTKRAPPVKPAPKKENGGEISAPSDFTPLKFEGNFLPLTPRTHSEAEIDELIKGIEVKLRGTGFRRINFDLHYGPELNLNPGPSGMRPTYEGTDLVIDLRTVQLKDGSTVEIDRYGGSSQTWLPEEKKFRDGRSVELKADIKSGTLEKVEGDVVLHFAVDTKAMEFTRPEDVSKIKSEDVPIDGLTVTPFWERRSFTVEFEAGSRNKIVHVRGIDEDGQELLITSVGGLDSRKSPDAGRHSYHFEDSGKKLARIQFFAAPKVVERRIPFDLKMAE